MSNLQVALPPDDFDLNDIADHAPEGLGEPFGYKIYVMPVKPKKEIRTNSGVVIHLPDESVDAQSWLNCIGRIVKMGPCAFKHPRWKELGLTEDQTPKVGDLILYAARSPHRFKFKGANILVINDDWITGYASEEHAGGYVFYV